MPKRSVFLWEKKSRGALGIGVDFGTTNSSAAVFDGEKLRMVELDPGFTVPTVMPSALYLNRELEPRVGRGATESYLRDNVGRRIRLEKEEVGEFLLSIDTMSGYFEDWVKVHAFTDKSLPSRLFRSVKTWLGDDSLDSVKVFSRNFRLVALITPMLEGIRKQLEHATNRTAESWGAHFGRPINYHGMSADANTTALIRMREACAHAGFHGVHEYPEPVAASLSFLHDNPSTKGQRILTFDFGGGTLDLCLLERSADGFSILATDGVAVGGDAIDSLIYRNFVFPEIGRGALVPRSSMTSLRDPDKVEFRFDDLEDKLLVWQHAHELNRNDIRERILRGMREGGETRKKLERLFNLISLNLSFRVFQAIEEAKVGLATRAQTFIRVSELDLEIPLAQTALATRLTPLLHRIEAKLVRLLSAASLEPTQIDAVVCTGGSSKLPMVQTLLEGLFPGRLIEHDVFTSIAAGLAIANYYGFPGARSEVKKEPGLA